MGLATTRFKMLAQSLTLRYSANSRLAANMDSVIQTEHFFFHADDKPSMIFYEAKLNETYAKSCRGKRYNSTLQGQLEMKWRLVNLFHRKSFQEDGGRKYIVESPEFADFYRSKDAFYTPVPNRTSRQRVAAVRHLVVCGGIRTVLEKYVNICQADRIYYLCSTNDDTNPLTQDSTYHPRCYQKQWADVRHQFCWINNSVIESTDRF